MKAMSSNLIDSSDQSARLDTLVPDRVSAALRKFFLIAFALGTGSVASAQHTEALPMCGVTVDFSAKPERRVVESEGGKVEVVTGVIGGGAVQSAFCGPGSATSAGEMRQLTGFVMSSKKLHNIRSKVVRSGTTWLFLADADSIANDGSTPTRFEYQCRADAPTGHLLCLIASGRKAGFPRSAADSFFDSVRSHAGR